MGKIAQNEFAIHDWVADLPFTQQALLFSIVRGPDGCGKYNTAKPLIYFMRGVLIKPAYNWDGSNNNTYMWGDYGIFSQATYDLMSDVDSFPHHFLMHLFHCAEVIGFKHPDALISQSWLTFYYNACDSLHMNPETLDQFNKRLKK